MEDQEDSDHRETWAISDLLCVLNEKSNRGLVVFESNALKAGTLRDILLWILSNQPGNYRSQRECEFPAFLLTTCFQVEQSFLLGFRVHSSPIELLELLIDLYPFLQRKLQC